ncbi:lipoprotein [Mycoplasma capricolum]|nr:lipoprotein [Mycoplasma capricolum]
MKKLLTILGSTSLLVLPTFSVFKLYKFILN